MTLVPTLVLSSIIITNAADLALHSQKNSIGTRFELLVRVISPYTEVDNNWTVEDDSGAIGIVNGTKGISPPQIGTTIKATGILREDGFDNEYAVPVCQSFSILSEGPPQIPMEITRADLFKKSCDSRLVSIKGIVQDVYQDEIDPLWFYIVLDCDGYLVNATFPSRTNLITRLQLLVDAQVEVAGICSTTAKRSKRRQAVPYIALKDVSAIRTIRAAPENPFSTPEVRASYRLGPMDISRMGRRRIRGTVLAAWQDNRALIRTPSGRLSGIEFAQPVPLSFGDVIEAVGFAETDLYRINLSRAIGRKIGATTNALEVATHISANDIFTDELGHPRINPDFHGKSIQLTGLVKGLYDINGLRNGIILEDRKQTIAIDCSVLPDLAAKTAAGCRIRISGTCILETDNWQPHAAFPKIKGVTLVPRIPTDLVVLSRPPWWTPGRLLAVIGVLLSILVAILVWNRILNRIIERRSRQLLRERSKRDDANLKNEERMRLAVELHDTISQNLAGLALQVDSAQLAVESEPASVPTFLESIRLRLLHCRKDLRNCLWDLRSRAFEEPTLSDAIKMTLTPHLNGTLLEVIGDVSSRELSDNVIHSVLCIIRELSVNAIRHGKAKNIRVTCRLNDERLAISVSDDGCGFDPEQRPDISTGHFGIQGVIERTERMEGSYVIESLPGHGTTFSINNLKTDL